MTAAGPSGVQQPPLFGITFGASIITGTGETAMHAQITEPIAPDVLTPKHGLAYALLAVRACCQPSVIVALAFLVGVEAVTVHDVAFFANAVRDAVYATELAHRGSAFAVFGV
jgi:hypothetical protein